MVVVVVVVVRLVVIGSGVVGGWVAGGAEVAAVVVVLDDVVLDDVVLDDVVLDDVVLDDVVLDDVVLDDAMLDDADGLEAVVPGCAALAPLRAWWGREAPAVRRSSPQPATAATTIKAATASPLHLCPRRCLPTSSSPRSFDEHLSTGAGTGWALLGMFADRSPWPSGPAVGRSQPAVAIEPLVQHVDHPVHGHPLLVHGVTVSDGDGVIVE